MNEIYNSTDENAAVESDESNYYVDSTGEYLSAIAKIVLLNAEQEVELSKDIEAGLYADFLLEKSEIDDNTIGDETREDYLQLKKRGEIAKNSMIEANLRLVAAQAKGYRGGSVPYLDLIQDGNIGLITAVEKFDYKRGYKFSTYANFWIRQAICRGIANKARLVRLPTPVVAKVNTLSKVKGELETELGRCVTDEELADAAGMTVADIEKYTGYSKSTLSLNIVVGGEDSTNEMGDIIPDSYTANEAQQGLEIENLRKDLHEIMSRLSERERRVVELSYGLDDGRQYTRQEIARKLCVGADTVAATKRRGLEKMRTYASEELRIYLDLF